VRDLVATFPPGVYRTISIKLLAACIAFGKASFTFTSVDSGEERTVDNVAYGKWEGEFYNAT
jgi:hypothetical protein